MKKHISLLFNVFFFSSVVLAQEINPLPCATDEMHQHILDEYPDLREPIFLAAQELEEFTQSYQPSSTRGGDPYIIPVVFHVIHNYGPENIEDEQIFDAVRQVNLQLRKQNADTVDIVDSFQSIATDTEIEIRLAQLDPDGNCTNGITRSVSGSTMTGDHSVKDVIHWPPDKYLNIYVCNQAASLAGHALLPSAADTIPRWDGIVMQHSYVGTIGTSNEFRRTVVTHEIGHYLNLQHIWGGNNVPDYYYLPVAESANCDFDDGVEDTPLTIGWQTCNLNGSSCGSLDNVQNYMDYAYCALMFTEGQKERMHACLNSPIANRNNLWSDENLVATGVKDYTPVLCEARIQASEQIICEGESVSFSDISFNGVSSRNWSFEGASINSSSDSSVVVTYAEIGEFDVTLEVSDGTETKSVTLENYIKVIPAQGELEAVNESFEYMPDFYNHWVVENPEKPLNWEVAQVGYQSNQSLKLANDSSENGASYAFFNQPIDVSSLNEFELRFDVAFARNTGSDADFLRIEVSTDCGETWTIRRNFSSSDLSEVGVLDVSEDWEPTSDEDWKSLSVTNISSNFLTDNLMVRFNFQSSGGNNIFIDNIQMARPNELSSFETLLEDQLLIFPNPSSGMINIQGLDEMTRGRIDIVDVLGKIVYSEQLEHPLPSILIDLNGVEQGIYSVVLHNEFSETISKRIVLTK